MSPSQSSPTTSADQPPTSHQQWWRDAVVYQVYPRSFADANGDGMGDLAGIVQHLEHIADLGADALWLSPFYRSPQHDGGYDVSDYLDVDPRFGTLEDADALVRRAHELGLKVIVDIVPNHCSSDHVLFRKALAAAPGSPEREMFIFREGAGEHGELPPNNWPSIFHGSAWTRVTEADGSPGQWYLHIFDDSQPDWNWENEAVRAMFDDIVRFWLDRGVDGFRVDVAHGMIKPEGLPDAVLTGAGMLDIPEGEAPVYFNQDGVHEIYRRWRKIFDEYDGDRMMVGEAWIPERDIPKYVAPDEMHQVFNFGFLQARWGVATMRRAIEEPLRLADEVGAPTTWVLSNHDTIRHATRYGFAPDHRFGEGLSREEIPDTALGLRRARAASLLMLALPGSAYLYQGEEFGLPEVADIPDELREDPAHRRAGVPGRDGCRVPLPWVKDAPAFGFSPTGQSWLPQPEVFAEHAADQLSGQDGSILELYRTAIALRRELKLGAHGKGDSVSFESDVPDGLLVVHHGPVTVLVNTTEESIELAPVIGSAEVLVESAAPEDREAGYLTADAAIWVRRVS